MSGGDVMVIVAVVGQFFLVGLILLIVFRRLEQKSTLRAQLEMKLIERFSTAKELEEFLSTEAGRRLLVGYGQHRGTPLRKIIGTIQVGTALVVLAVGVLLVAMMSGKGFALAAAILIFAIGFGLLAAAAVGRRLVRAWALNGRENDSTLPTPRA